MAKRVTFITHSCACGRPIKKKVAEFYYFEYENFTITPADTLLKKRCWKCDKKPVPGEKWSLAFSRKHKNRFFCPECSSFIKEAMAEKQAE